MSTNARRLLGTLVLGTLVLSAGLVAAGAVRRSRRCRQLQRFLSSPASVPAYTRHSTESCWMSPGRGPKLALGTSMS